MNKKGFRAAFVVILLTAGFLCLPYSNVVAGEQIRIKSMVQSREQVDDPLQLRLRLKSQLCKEYGLSEEEVDALDPILSQSLELNGGDPEPIRNMVRKAVQIDCVGECLMERLRVQNRLMLQEQKQNETGDKLAAQERLTTRTQTRSGDQSGDLTRTETRTQTRDQSGSGSGEGKGKTR